MKRALVLIAAMVLVGCADDFPLPSTSCGSVKGYDDVAAAIDSTSAEINGRENGWKKLSRDAENTATLAILENPGTAEGLKSSYEAMAKAANILAETLTQNVNGAKNNLESRVQQLEAARGTFYQAAGKSTPSGAVDIPLALIMQIIGLVGDIDAKVRAYNTNVDTVCNEKIANKKKTLIDGISEIRMKKWDQLVSQ